MKLAPHQTWANLRAPLVVLVLAAFVFAIGIGHVPVMDRDEALFAQASRQMAETGDWVDIRFQDDARYKKPVGIYWAQAGFAKLLGTTQIWVYRLPSYLGAVIACLALIWAGTPLVGRRAAVTAGFMLSCLFLLHVEARLAKTDAALLAASVLAMGALAHAWMSPAPRWPTAAVFWTAIAAGILLKGPLVVMPVLGAVVWIAVFARQIAWLRRLRPLWGLAWVLALCLPWYIAITIKSDGAFIETALFGDLIGKIETAQESHGAPPGSYALAFWLTFWPWTMLVPGAAILAWRKRADPALVFLTGWVVPFWLLLEFTPTKLPHYPLLLYPAILLMAAAAVQGRGPGWVGAVLWAVGFVAFAALALIAPAQLGNGVVPASVAGVGLSVAISAAAVYWARRGRTDHALAAVGAGAITLYATLFVVVLPALGQLWISPRLQAATAGLGCLDGPVVLSGYGEPSVVFLLGTDTLITDRDTALATVQQTPGAMAWIASDTRDGIEGQTQVSGLNYNAGRWVTLRLFVWPGVPAVVPVCPEGGS